MANNDTAMTDVATNDAGGSPLGGGDVAGPHGYEPELQVRRLDPDVPLPSYAHEGDAGLDLASAAEVTLQPGERAAVPTGLALAIPAGWVGLVHPRSGLARRHGVTVTNAPGTIDAGYRGEVQVLLINLGDAPVTLQRGDRIAQLLLQEVGRARVVEVAELDDTSRGDGGFGSTGISEPVAPGARGLLPHG